jgi:hypothetical protein
VEEDVRGEFKVVGVFDEIATILGRERGDVNGFPIKIIDEALAETEREVGREIDVSGASFGEISVEEALEVGPPPCQTLPVGDMNATRRRRCRVPIGFTFGVVGVETKGKFNRLLLGSGGGGGGGGGAGAGIVIHGGIKCKCIECGG